MLFVESIDETAGIHSCMHANNVIPEVYHNEAQGTKNKDK